MLDMVLSNNVVYSPVGSESDASLCAGDIILISQGRIDNADFTKYMSVCTGGRKSGIELLHPRNGLSSSETAGFEGSCLVSPATAGAAQLTFVKIPQRLCPALPAHRPLKLLWPSFARGGAIYPLRVENGLFPPWPANNTVVVCYSKWSVLHYDYSILES